MIPSKKKRIAGWVLTVLVALFMIFGSASGKFTEWEGKAEMFQKLGFTNDLMFKIGIVEVTVAILYLIPQTSFLGAILLTGYLGGAVVTHVRVNEAAFFFPIIVGVLAWIGLALRRPEIFSLAFGNCCSTSAQTMHESSS